MDYFNLPDEDQYIEYKKNSSGLSKEMWETVSSFANTEGGVIILGITEERSSDDRSVFSVTGVSNPHKLLEDFWSTADRILNINNVTNDDVKVIDVLDKKIIEITVPEAKVNQKPIRVNGTPYLRKGSVDVKAKGEDLKQLLINNATDLDTNVLHNYWTDDLDIDSVKEYKDELTSREQYSGYKQYNLEDFLRKIGVISKDYEGNGKEGITVGGLLFFGNNNAIIHSFPYFQLDYLDQSKPNIDRWLNRISSVTDNLNIYSFYKRTLAALSTTVVNKFALDGSMNRKDTAGAMLIALREALLNMLMHANYYGKDPLRALVKVNYYEFINPGRMLVPADSFFTTNMTKSRNPIISKLFVQLGESERAGHGGEKIYESAAVNNYRKPEINTDYNGTNLRIWKVDYADSFSGKEITDRDRLILKVIITDPSQEMSHKEIEKRTGLTRSKVDKSLQELIGKKIIEKKGNGRATKYGIRQTQEQIIALVQELPSMMRKIFQRERDNGHD